MDAQDGRSKFAIMNEMASSSEKEPLFRRPRIDLWNQFENPADSPIRSLPDLVRFNAKHNPSHLFCVQAKASLNGVAVAPTRITFLEFHQAVRRCCRWINENVPNTTAPALTESGELQKGPSVALLLESDIGLFIHLVALLSLGIPSVLLSIRLSFTAIQHLLQNTSTASVLVSSRTRKAAEEAVSKFGGDSLAPCVLSALPYGDFLSSQPTLDENLGSARGDQSQLGNEERNLVRDDDLNVLILHSSGTTGLPKPIRLAHRYLLGYATCHRFPESHVFRGPNVSTLPLYHGFGLLAPCLSLSVGMTFCLPPSSIIPMGNSTVSLIERLQASSLMTVPAIMEDLVEDSNRSDMMAVLARLDFVAVGGGAIKSSVGEVLSKRKTPLLAHYGVSEIGALAYIFCPDEQYDWRYLRLRSDLGLQLKYASDGPNARDEKAPRRCKVIGYPFGWDSAFEVQDELECNPLHPDTEVKILGRSDDLIVLATGEKVRPGFLENSLSQTPLVRAAVVFGDGRFELGIIVEPSNWELVHQEDVQGTKELVDKLWQVVVTANAMMDNHAQVSSRSSIIVTPPEKPIPRSDKGSPMRKETYALFSGEIDAVYDRLKNGIANGISMQLDLCHLEDELEAIVQKSFLDRVLPETWGIYDDLFELGMDSLQASKLLRTLKASVVKGQTMAFHLRDLPRDFVYSNPSVSQMAVEIRSRVNPSGHSAPSRTALMENLVLKHSIDKNVVLLTGSTGNLGSHLIEQLCQEPSVHRIVCLTRSDKSGPATLAGPGFRTRQEKVNIARKISIPAAAWLKVESLSWDVGAEDFGLDKREYSRLLLDVTHILHAAWPMDFRRKLQSFDPHIKAVKSLMELAIAAHQVRPHVKPRVLFASSIAAVGQYPLVHGNTLVPESPTSDPSVTVPMGYAEAKWVCEKIIEAASHSHREEIQPFIVRIGQISGSEKTSYWNADEHFPALVKASQALGQMPDLHGSLSWLPVDCAARALVEMLIAPGSRKLIYHLENPVRQPWSDVCTVISRKLGLKGPDRIPFESWIDRITANESNMFGLAEFFEAHFLRMATGGLVLDTQQARDVSLQLRSMGTISQELIEFYVDSWRTAGFLT